jgi:hypothetical protein
MKTRHRDAAKLLLMQVVGLALYLVVLGTVKVLWPTETSMSSDVLSYPLAALSTTIIQLRVAKMAWGKQSNGAYTWSDKVRWAFAGLFLCGMTCTIATSALMLFREFLISR